jgi:hypothetical protein
MLREDEIVANLAASMLLQSADFACETTRFAKQGFHVTKSVTFFTTVQDLSRGASVTGHTNSKLARVGA